VLSNPIYWFDLLGLDPLQDARDDAMHIVLTGQRNAGLEHSCAVCCVPDTSNEDVLDCSVGPTKKGDEETVQVPVCRYGFPQEFIHSHPAGRPTVSEHPDMETAHRTGVTVTAVEPNGRGSSYTPGSGRIPHFDHDF